MIDLTINMDKPLWKFTDNQGTFVSETADRINSLYFPLCNAAPIMSSLTPRLGGDLKTGFDSFLLQPVSRRDLHNLKSSRNFWIYINPQKIWSATGVSKDTALSKFDKFKLEGGLLWQKLSRENKKVGLKAEILSFIPSSEEPVELMLVEITNISLRPVKFTPCAAIPIFGRSPHNLHDHSHVTSLLQRIKVEKSGVVVNPTLVFDESGHRKNITSYFVLGIDEKYGNPQYIYPTEEEFIGEGSDLESPEALINNLPPSKGRNIQGKEVMAGLKFKPSLLKPQHSSTYIVIMGIVSDQAQIPRILKKFDSRKKVDSALNKTKSYWQKISLGIKINTGDPTFDNWFRWVNIQPVLRKIFGCSFLPDFDYGKGGRGWRDLWQDHLSLILNNPDRIKSSLINNFAGIRIDGSNATIIGKKSNEFIADRNNISRVWMDHGIWPLLTTQLYIHQTGDLNILLEENSYFRDHQLFRSKLRDEGWHPEDGMRLKTKKGKVYQGTILEHLLLQNLVQFFNVGPHNFIRLEDADWNDGLDMAAEFGESVAFTAMYAQNLATIAELIEKLHLKKIVFLQELLILLDSAAGDEISYSDISAKKRLLNKYFESTKYGVDGKKVSLPKDKVIEDLRKKAGWLNQHIRKNEWLKEGFFNGYYNNDKQRVEGKIKGRLRMTLAGQALPIMSGVADRKQTETIFTKVKKYLKDKKLGGFRLNTDFGAEQLNLGRAFSFIYGDKENGAFFSHMAVMFAYALYKQGFAKEGYEVINSIYKMALDSKRSKIYPCIPEYFNGEGRGMYSYLTGSASWFLLTLQTQMFGVRGEYGDLVIEPQFTAEQFKVRKTLEITTHFLGKAIKVNFLNPRHKGFPAYSISRVSFNHKTIAQNLRERRFSLPRKKFLSLSRNTNNIIEVILD